MKFRVKSIEGCRGLAALVVMLTHFVVMFYPAIYWGAEYTHLKHGLDYRLGQLLPFPSADSGITMFLLITGFGSYIAIDSGRINIRKYLFLRYPKLLVLTLLGALPVVLLLHGGLVFVPDIADSLHTPWFNGWPPVDAPLGQLILHNPIGAFVVYNNVLWTMPYFFYGAMLSFVLTSIFSGSLRQNFYVSLAAALILANISQYYYMACIAGTFLGFCYKHRSDIFQFSRLQKAIISLLALYFCSYPTGITGPEGIFWRHGFEQAYIFYHVAGNILFMLLTLCPYSLAGHVMESKLFQWLGRYSMGIYLIHYSILVSPIAWLYSYLPAESYLEKIAMLLPVYIGLGLMAGMAVQAIGNHLFCLLDKLYACIFRRCCQRE